MVKLVFAVIISNAKESTRHRINFLGEEQATYPSSKGYNKSKLKFKKMSPCIHCMTQRV